MDGAGLRKFLLDRPKEHESIRVELRDAFGSARDAAVMVLDAVEGFGSVSHFEMKRACLILLEELMGMKVEIKGEVRKRAMKIAVGWKVKLNGSTNTANIVFEVLGFLLLVGVYGLMSGFSVDDLVSYAVTVAKNKVAVQLVRVLNFGDKIAGKLLRFGLLFLLNEIVCEYLVVIAFWCFNVNGLSCFA